MTEPRRFIPPSIPRLLLYLALLGLALLSLAFFLTMAEAQPMPVPKQGNCPSGFPQSGSYCNPTPQTKCRAIPKPPKGQCPADWRDTGSYCVETKCN